mmetsp:Transcript_108841/g.351380  ORF Transcript_108841/g.351380 Transcript_108841/m.351380 type:complete len:246 (-) Transcript_108841:447-1184(-)
MMARTALLKCSMLPKAAWMMPSSFSLSCQREQLHSCASKSSKAALNSSRSSSSRLCLRTGMKSISLTLPPTWTYAKTSTTHQRRERYVVPQSITRREQPLRKTGKLRRSASMLFWLMQHLSIQTRGSRDSRSLNFERQLCSAAHLATASSCHEWETNASQSCPNLAGMERVNSLGLGRFSSMSCWLSSSRLMQRKRALACERVSFTEQSPTSPAMPAAEAWVVRTLKIRCSSSCRAWRSCGLLTT